MKNSTCVVRKIIVSFVLLVMSVLSGNAQQVAKNLTASNGVYIGFYEYKPVNYDANPTTKYPLIIFLHGVGERGNGTTDLPLVLNNAIPRYINNGNTMTFYWNGKWETFLVLSPQLSYNYGDWQNFYVDEMINYAKNNMRVDTNRIFLTGLSLGGGGVWKYATSSLANAKKFAAITPVCGTCAAVTPCNIASANLPLWAFHSQDDQVVGVGCTTGQVGNVNNCNPAVKPLMTIWPDGNHWSWDRAYDTVYNWSNPNLYEWFLGQNKSLPVNILPVARAGADYSITLPTSTAVLNASASSDADGTIQRYIWRKLSGPAAGVIQTPNQVTSNVTGMYTAGVYTFELKVVDDRTAVHRDTINITVNPAPPGTNLPPIAVAGPDQNITTTTAVVTSYGSSDPDGSIASYQWTKVSGPASFGFPNGSIYPSADLNSLTSGTYLIELKVTDNLGAVGRDTVAITVNVPAANLPPIANAGSDITITLPTNSTTLIGTGSTDPDGTITSYTWSKISGPASNVIANPNGSTTGISNLVQGTYSFRLQVIDNGGLSTSDTVNVIVNAAAPPPNQAPVANAGGDITITLPTNSTTLNGTGSSDPDGTITTYSWTKISGPAAGSITNPGNASTGVTGLTQGTYSFRLQVTDNGGLSAADTMTVTVNAAPPPPNQAPVANAGGDITISLPANSTTLNGSGSSDPDGTIITYAWSKISGPAGETIVSPGNATSSVTGLVQGVYSFRLLVTDNGGLTAADTVTVTVNSAPPPPNQAPVANAGGNITITLPTNSTTLNGTSSYDADGTISSYSWTKISGPASGSISNASAVSTALTGLTQGTYQYQLIVTDNGGLTDADTVTVTVNAAPPPPNQAPVANAGGNISITLPINSTSLNGSSSYDPDGTIASYSWSKISGPASGTLTNAGSATSSLSGLVQGVYTYQLVVTDNGGLTDADTVTVTVNAAAPPPNQAPVANAGGNISITLPTNSSSLNGAASTDPDGTIVSYSWTKISGPATGTLTNATSAVASLSGLVQGTYSYQLQVTDNGGLTDLDTVQVTVNPAPNQLPVANAGADINASLPNPGITLNGSASYDPDGTIVSYDWVKISGPGAITITNSTTATPGVTGVQAGIYIFELTVTDDKGAIAKDQVQVTVGAALNSLPVAVAGKDTTVSAPASTAFLNASASYDPDGTIVSYSWKQIAGPTAAVIANSQAAVTNASGLGTGTYSFELTVTDNKGAVAKDSINITIVNNLRYVESLKVYPNPAQNNINIRVISDSTGITLVNIYDMNGKVVKRAQYTKGQPYFESPAYIQNLKNGIYYVEVIIGTRKKMITKFIKQ